MKKLLIVVLSLVLIFALSACGGSGSSDSGSTDGEAADPNFVWTLEGQFEDGNGNYLMIYESDDQETYPGWSVSMMIGEEMHGWFIQQEGETLHGDLTSEYEEGNDPFVVTVSEEGEGGVLVVTEAGDEYHFTQMELPEILYTLQINIDGIGEIAYAPEGEEPVFDDEFPAQSSVKNIVEGDPTSYVLAARVTDEDYEFVKWTKNGEDYSTDDKITVEVTEDVEYRAVFEIKE